MDRESVLELYDRYAQEVYRLSLSFLGRRADAEDMVQSVFLRLMEKRLGIGSGKEKAYLLTMTANLCRNQLKSAAVRLAAGYEEGREPAAELYTEAESDVYQAMMKLPETYRVCLYLHYYEGYGYREIRKMLKLSSSAVSMRISRGREAMKQVLREEDWT